MTRYLGILLVTGLVTMVPCAVLADGKVMAPRDYQGSLEETAQEAIIVCEQEGTFLVEHMTLKISVTGAPERFGWVIPFPSIPEIVRADPGLFAELFEFVRLMQPYRGDSGGGHAVTGHKEDAKPAVDVLARKTVGTYDTAVLRENVGGGLNEWLDQEGFQTLTDAEDVLSFYRERNYVFVCIKVEAGQLESLEPVDFHPLRFSFTTGGRDGIYFPMKMTGLQEDPFDVNLYVFYRAWLNDHINGFGYTHRGFELHYRDWDTPECESNGGKSWDNPGADPLLAHTAWATPNVAGMFKKYHAGKRFYLTNIRASGLKPDEVRNWPDDLWLFPYYTNPEMVPFDAREGGPAIGYYDALVEAPEASQGNGSDVIGMGVLMTVSVIAGFMVLFLIYIVVRRFARSD